MRNFSSFNCIRIKNFKIIICFKNKSKNAKCNFYKWNIGITPADFKFSKIFSLYILLSIFLTIFHDLRFLKFSDFDCFAKKKFWRSHIQDFRFYNWSAAVWMCLRFFDNYFEQLTIVWLKTAVLFFDVLLFYQFWWIRFFETLADNMTLKILLHFSNIIYGQQKTKLNPLTHFCGYSLQIWHQTENSFNHFEHIWHRL